MGLHLQLEIFCTNSHDRQDAHRIVCYGVLVTTAMHGKWQQFSLDLLVNTAVNSLVLLTLPFCLIQFILLHCLGFLSGIYMGAKRSVLNISESFYSAIMRMMIAEAGFRGLMG